MTPFYHITRGGLVRLSKGKYRNLGKMECWKVHHWIVAHTGIAHAYLVPHGLSFCGQAKSEIGDRDHADFKRRCYTCCYATNCDPRQPISGQEKP